MLTLPKMLDDVTLSFEERLEMAKEIIKMRDKKIERLEARIAEMNSDKAWEYQATLGGTM
jgi:hypothetical protein